MHTFIRPPIHPSYWFVCPSVLLSIRPFIHPSVRISVPHSVRPFVCKSVSMLVRLFICLSVYSSFAYLPVCSPDFLSLFCSLVRPFVVWSFLFFFPFLIVYSFTHLFVCFSVRRSSFVRSFVRSFVSLFVRSFVHLFLWFVRSFVRLFVHLLICSFPFCPPSLEGFSASWAWEILFTSWLKIGTVCWNPLLYLTRLHNFTTEYYTWVYNIIYGGKFR